jgi:hypothetical protein
MSAPRERPGEPSVYARLAQEADVRMRAHAPPRGTRLIGWLICVAVGATLLVAGMRVPT